MTSTDGGPAGGPSLVRDVPLRGMRGAIARTMSTSLRDMAQLTLHRRVDTSRVEQARTDATAVARVGDLVLCAVARTLKDRPDVNATLTDDVIHQWGDVHLGVAVSLDAGLVVPVIRHADRLSPSDIGAQVAAVATRARSGGLTVFDMDGATFTVTNLGAYGIDFFTPIINPPQVAILGVGRSSGGSMVLSLTIDHRALDGAPGAQFLAAVAEKLEAPQQLLTAIS